MKQMSIYDWMPEASPAAESEEKKLTHAEFEKHCNHGGSWKPIKDEEGNIIGSQHMCGYANGKNARCWDDWIPCTEENCYLLKGK